MGFMVILAMYSAACRGGKVTALINTFVFLSESTHTHTHTHTHLGLDVERDEAVRDQVVDGLEPLLSNKVLPVVVETEVSRLVPKPGRNEGGHFNFGHLTENIDA